MVEFLYSKKVSVSAHTITKKVFQQHNSPDGFAKPFREALTNYRKLVSSLSKINDAADKNKLLSDQKTYEIPMNDQHYYC